ncbi:MAG: NUDIX domain-containing protein [Chloroflexi bacterium]|nr:NUDIX domain-containing protein [Chloroflexota bacterium]
MARGTPVSGPDLGLELAGATPTPVEVDYPHRWLRWIAPALRRVTLADGRTAQVALVIQGAAGRVLLAERPRQRLFALPTGGVQPGETIAAAAQREAAEETGLTVELTACPAVIRHWVGGRLVLCSYVVLLRSVGDVHQVPQGNEATSFGEARPDELLDLAGRWQRVREPLFGSLYGQLQAQLLTTASQILRGEHVP